LEILTFLSRSVFMFLMILAIKQRLVHLNTTSMLGFIMEKTQYVLFMVGTDFLILFRLISGFYLVGAPSLNKLRIGLSS
jgi:hypothetical protein